jgi:hypothetical protein
MDGKTALSTSPHVRIQAAVADGAEEAVDDFASASCWADASVRPVTMF